MPVSQRKMLRTPSVALSGAQKAALVLLALERSRAHELVRQLAADDVRRIVRAAGRLNAVDADVLDVVVREFEEAFRDGVNFLGTASEVRSIVAEVVGPEEVDEALRAAPTRQEPPWEEIGLLPDDILRDYLARQHPQAAAMILVKLQAAKAADLLRSLSAPMRKELIGRMLAVGKIATAFERAIEDAVRSELLGNVDKPASNVHQKVAGIINQFDLQQADEVLQHLATAAPGDLSTVRKLLFRFDDLIKLPPSSLAVVIDRLPIERILLALQGTSPEFQSVILAPMAPRARRMAEAELQSGVVAPARDVNDARRFVGEFVLHMIADGAIAYTAPDTAETVASTS